MQNVAYKDDRFSRELRPGYLNTRDYLYCNAPEQPVFLFSEQRLKTVSRSFQLAFNGEVSYAVKANPEKAVLKALWDSGIRSFDVASINEIALLKELFPDCHLHYNNPIKSTVMIDQAYELYGVRSFVVDDLAGLKLLVPYITPEVEITVRFKLEHESAAYDFGSKFGASPEQSVELLRQTGELGAKCALTFHPGSQCESARVYHRYVKVAAEIAGTAGVVLERLNVGGGFPVAYENSSVMEVREYFAVIDEAVDQYFSDQRPQLLCEPGRAMVASCTSLLTQVLHVRESGEVFINDGVYGGMQEQSIMDSELPLRIWRNGEQIERSGDRRTLFGPTCDPLDRLSGQYQLCEDIEEGDYIEFRLMGAYGSATATRFNGFEPGEYVSVSGF